MLSLIHALVHPERDETSARDTLLEDWQRQLASATSAHERDEINDMFGQALDAA
jgi:hypothetical protein